jgi:hypothetical protein
MGFILIVGPTLNFASLILIGEAVGDTTLGIMVDVEGAIGISVKLV